MEKALLKVTRFNNSDVIATSGVCNHTEHFHINSVNDETASIDDYMWVNGEWDGPKPIDNYPVALLKRALNLESITAGATYGDDGQLCDNNNPHS